MTHDRSKMIHDHLKMTHDRSKTIHDHPKMTHDRLKMTHDQVVDDFFPVWSLSSAVGMQL